MSSSPLPFPSAPPSATDRKARPVPPPFGVPLDSSNGDTASADPTNGPIAGPSVSGTASPIDGPSVSRRTTPSEGGGRSSVGHANIPNFFAEEEDSRRYLRHLEPDISFLDRLKTPAFIILAICVALFFVLFSTWAHYNLDQAPHRMFKILAGVIFLVLLFVRPEHTLLVLPFALPFSERLPVSPLPMANSKNILMAALLLAWIGHGVLRGERIMERSPWNRPLLLFFGWAVLTTIFGVFNMGDGASDIYPMLQSLWNHLMGFVLFFVTFNTVRTREQVQRLAYLYCVGAGFGALGVLSEYRGYSYGKRVGGGMGDINGAGAYFAGAIVVTLEVLAAKAKRGWHRVLLVGALIGSGVGLILPASRGAILACGFSGGLQALRGGPVRILLVAITAIGIFFAMPDHVKQRFTETQEEVASGDVEKGSSGRTEIWKATVDVIAMSPLIGVGWGQLPTAMEQTAYGDGRVAHNLYLEIWAEAGIPGLVLVLVLFGIGIREALALRREEGFARILGNAFFYYMLALVIANVFGGRLFTFYSSGALSILAALVFRMRAIIEEERLAAWQARRAQLEGDAPLPLPLHGPGSLSR